DVPMYPLVEPANKRRVVATPRQAHALAEQRFTPFEPTNHFDFYTARELSLDAPHGGGYEFKVLVVAGRAYEANPHNLPIACELARGVVTWRIQTPEPPVEKVRQYSYVGVVVGQPVRQWSSGDRHQVRAAQ